MKQKQMITTLAVLGSVVAAHHATPAYASTKNTNSAPQNKATVLMNQTSVNTIGEITNTSFLHFRSSASIYSPIIRTLYGNQKMIILGTEGSWYKVNIDGTIGYVYSYYVNILHSTPNLNTSIGTGNLVHTNFLHFRDSASINSNIIETLYPSNKITVLSKDGAWYKVSVDGKVGYVYGYYLNVTPTPSVSSKTQSNNQVSNNSIGTATLANTTFLHFRSAATTDSNIIETLYSNDKIVVLSKDGSWYKVSVNGQVGYVFGYYLNITPNSNASNKKQNTNQNTNNKAIGIGTLVNTTFLHFRSAATTNSNILETLYSNDKITVLSKDGSWYKVSVNGQVGYVYGYYLTVTPNITVNTNDNNDSKQVIGQVINSSFLHVRSGAGTDFSILQDIYPNQNIDVLKKVGNWYEIKVSGKIGYVYGYYLKIVSGSLSNNNSNNNSNTTNTPTSNNSNTANNTNNNSNSKTSNTETGIVVNTSTLNIRSGAGTNYPILDTLNKGQQVSIISTNNGWFEISYNNSTAYVSANYISLISGNISNPNSSGSINGIVPLNETGSVEAYLLNIRANASIDSEVIGHETLNSPVEIIGEKGDFYQIKLGNSFGFVYKPFISITSYNNSNNNNSNNNGSANTNNSGNNGTSSTGVSFPTANSNEIKTSYPISLQDYVNMEHAAWPLYSVQTFMNAINPQDIDNMFEFLRIDTFRDVSVQKLNNLLNGDGILSGQGQAFINACRTYNIDPVYFVSQSILETGYGESVLAKGVTISQVAIQSEPIYNSNGNLIGYQMQNLPHPVTVYDLYGIGAEDNLPNFPDRALVLGTTYAYTHGWTSISAAISGAAEFVSNNYIHNNYYNQNTIYKFRYSPKISSIWHQYASDVWYAKSIADLMDQNKDLYDNDDSFTYDIPSFKNN